ncbi:MAG: prolipoprotein diacylglyceryl transferase [Bryobacteraceae bacterium]|nr:prolipoprotein diacylglyceryl transferase [Bryobacteraceae bacterium]MDW8378164.1 prolipoprotein diacylglyceryl transferase [Bryobacterales bacterium]
MYPKLFSIGGFYLPTYGLLVALGFLLGLWITAKLAPRRGLQPQTATDLGVYIALAGLVGAKLLMFLYDFRFYRNHPEEIFSLSTLQAGGVFYGGLIAALAVAAWYLRSRKLAFLPVADVFAPGIALGHAIGRLGCFAAGCCWGTACDRPWAVTFDKLDAYQLVGVPLGVPLHPTQLYEAAAEAVIFVLLYQLFRRDPPPGRVIGAYLVLYPLARFFIEFVRFHEQPNPFGLILSNAQWMTLGLITLGLGLLWQSRAPAAAAVTLTRPAKPKPSGSPPHPA